MHIGRRVGKKVYIYMCVCAIDRYTYIYIYIFIYLYLYLETFDLRESLNWRSWCIKPLPLTAIVPLSKAREGSDLEV